MPLATEATLLERGRLVLVAGEAGVGKTVLLRRFCARHGDGARVLDVHWADDATLDVLRLLSRRIATVPALLVATYRDDELDRAHPLRIALGELARREVTERVRLVAAILGKLGVRTRGEAGARALRQSLLG